MFKVLLSNLRMAPFARTALWPCLDINIKLQGSLVVVNVAIIRRGENCYDLGTRLCNCAAGSVAPALLFTSRANTRGNPVLGFVLCIL